jgi:hypothetical protein
VKILVIGLARDGSPTASYGNARIHSAYDPWKEARKFAESRIGGVPDHGTVIIIGAALGYLDCLIRRLRPGVSIIAVHLDPVLFESRIDQHDPPGKVARWHPGMNIDFESFLYGRLKEPSLAGLRIIEWPPAAEFRRELADSVLSVISRIVRRLSGNISSTAAFGRAWIRNSLRNFTEAEYVLIPRISGRAVVLAASGPSLEDALPILRRNRDKFQLWALPSSMAALIDSGLTPDLIISTDPGYWAALHSRYFTRGCPVAMPLSAVPLGGGNRPLLIIDQGTPGDELLGKGCAWPSVSLPEAGTVAATALELWKHLSRNILILAGLDLCWRDLMSHVRPHTFDGWLSTQESRINPIQNIRWTRSIASAPKRLGGVRTGSPLQTYADWFGSAGRSERVFRLTPPSITAAAAVLPGVSSAGAEIFERVGIGNRAEPLFDTVQSPGSRRERKKIAQGLLKDWMDRLSRPYDRQDPVVRELAYLLDPGGVLEMERSAPEALDMVRSRHLERVKSILGQLGSRNG